MSNKLLAAKRLKINQGDYFFGLVVFMALTLGHNALLINTIETSVLDSTAKHNHKIQPLSKRLSAIDDAVANNFDHVWDCCCDHGYLGRHLLARAAAPNIHFVDIVPNIIDQLERHLAGTSTTSSQYHIYCQDVAKLPLDNFDTDDKHLIIIAGVGGDLTLQIVEQLVDNNPDQELEFILCPLRQQFVLRNQLANRGLKLIDELLVKDDKLFYEIIHLTTGQGEPIEGVGSKLWCNPNQWHVQHLQIVLAHFKRMANNPANNVDSAIANYQQLLAKLS